MAVNAARDLPKAAAAAAIVALAFLPMAKMPAFYESFIYLIFFWVSLSTSWALLSGFAGYFSLGHAAFFGVGVYTTAALTTQFGVPFLGQVPLQPRGNIAQSPACSSSGSPPSSVTVTRPARRWQNSSRTHTTW